MRHAYLIIAHDNFDILKKTIRMIDDERNDIYLHIDRKVKDFDFEAFSRLPKTSRLIFTDRIRVSWGTNSQVDCEYLLFRAAAPGHYGYYHLISGTDMPLVTQDVIHDFFDRHAGTEFVAFDSRDSITEAQLNRLKYYHFFISWKRSRHRAVRFAFKVQHTLTRNVQRLLGIDRVKKQGLVIRKGSNWVSITDGFLQYILSQEARMKGMSRHTYSMDEELVQTLLYNSPFYASVCDGTADAYGGILRCIDWNRGLPYTFREEDFDLLVNSGCFWARKISRPVSGRLPELLYQHVAQMRAQQPHTDKSTL